MRFTVGSLADARNDHDPANSEQRNDRDTHDDEDRYRRPATRDGPTPQRCAASAGMAFSISLEIHRPDTMVRHTYSDAAMIDATDILAARILVVDDDADTASTLTQALLLNGYSAVSTTSDPRAVHDLHRTHDYDLILLDVQMPGMDGFQVMEDLKEFERDGYLPVLALTGEPGHRIRALKLGARDFLRKPVDVDELLLRVRNMVEVRLLYKERMPTLDVLGSL